MSAGFWPYLQFYLWADPPQNMQAVLLFEIQDGTCSSCCHEAAQTGWIKQPFVRILEAESCSQVCRLWVGVLDSHEGSLAYSSLLLSLSAGPFLSRWTHLENAPSSSLFYKLVDSILLESHFRVNDSDLILQQLSLRGSVSKINHIEGGLWVLRGHAFACHGLLQGEETMGSFHDTLRRLQALGLGSLRLDCSSTRG